LKIPCDECEWKGRNEKCRECEWLKKLMKRVKMRSAKARKVAVGLPLAHAKMGSLIKALEEYTETLKRVEPEVRKVYSTLFKAQVKLTRSLLKMLNEELAGLE